VCTITRVSISSRDEHYNQREVAEFKWCAAQSTKRSSMQGFPREEQHEIPICELSNRRPWFVAMHGSYSMFRFCMSGAESISLEWCLIRVGSENEGRAFF
jgi:hypothetical protein